MQPRTFITPSISTNVNSSPPGSFTFATLPTATQMTAEMTGVQAFTTDQGMCYWSGSAWVAGAFSTVRTAAEITNGITPVNPIYPPGDVRRYGAVGDNVTDDTTSFSNAITANQGLTVYVPVPPTAYKITSTLTALVNTTIQGSNKRTCKISVSGNNDAFVLQDGACLYQIYIEGNGGTGRGLVINSGQGNQTVGNCRIINFNCGSSHGVIDYTSTDAGSRSYFFDIECWQTNGTSGSGNYAIMIADGVQLAAYPRAFTGLQTNGSCAISWGGATDGSLTQSFVADLAYSANTRGCSINTTRIANQANLTINGHNNSIVCDDINPIITIASGADAITLGPGSYNNLPIVDNSGNNRNNITHWGIAYTPTLTSGGTAPVLGNGTLTGIFERTASLITFTVNFTVGSTTTLGTGDLRFSLPQGRSNGDIPTPASLVINHAGTLFTAIGQINGNVNYVTFIRDTSGSITATSPATWGTGDTFRVTGTYNL